MNILNKETAPGIVTRIIAEALVALEEQVTPEISLAQYSGENAWKMLVIVNGLEQKLGMDIPDEAIAKFQTVQDVINFVLEQAALAPIAPVT